MAHNYTMKSKSEKAMTLKETEALVGGLSETTKMPTLSYGLPAKWCRTGGKLRKVPGSVCSKCYACKNAYVWPVVKNAYRARLTEITEPTWVANMITLMKGKKKIQSSGLFRWHDSGDFQGEWHIAKVMAVAEATPEITHWIPTKEKAMVKRYFRMNPKPANVVIRLSAAMIDGKAPEFEHTSTVTTDPAKATCRSFENKGKCGTCRKCWDVNVKNVAYLAH